MSGAMMCHREEDSIRYQSSPSSEAEYCGESMSEYSAPLTDPGSVDIGDCDPDEGE